MYIYIYMILWLYLNTIDIRLQKHNIKYLQKHNTSKTERETSICSIPTFWETPAKVVGFANPTAPIRSIRGTRSEVRQLDGRGTFCVSTSNCSARLLFDPLAEAWSQEWGSSWNVHFGKWNYGYNMETNLGIYKGKAGIKFKKWKKGHEM